MLPLEGNDDDDDEDDDDEDEDEDDEEDDDPASFTCFEALASLGCCFWCAFRLPCAAALALTPLLAAKFSSVDLKRLAALS